MSEIPSFDFGKFVPGFDFLQNLAKGASSSMAQLPKLSNWVAPTFSVEELEKRIEELKTVQFWLEQNSRALAATLQALEVQKMTLVTLKGMNFSMGDMAQAFQPKTAHAAGASGKVAAETRPPATARQGAAQAGSVAPAAQHDPAAPAADSASSQTKHKASGATESAVVDAMQWWGALTHQFQQIAAQAMQDAAKQTAAMDARKNIASDLAQGLAQQALETASAMARPLGAQGRQQTSPRGQRATASASAAPKPAAAVSKKTAAKPVARAARKSPARGAAAR